MNPEDNTSSGDSASAAAASATAAQTTENSDATGGAQAPVTQWGEAPYTAADLASAAASEEGDGTGQKPGESDAGTQTETKHKFGDKEYLEKDILEALDTAQRAKEIERGSHERFQKAATAIADNEAHSDWLEVAKAYKSGTIEQAEQLLGEIAKAGGFEIRRIGATSASDVGGGTQTQTQSTFDPTKYESDGERHLASELDRVTNALVATQRELAAIRGQVAPVVDYTANAAERDAMAQMKGQLKEKFGLDATDEQLKGFKDNGITDPIKAFEFIKPFLTPQAGGTQPGTKPPELPPTGARTFDLDDPNLSDDDVLDLRRKGYTPMQKGKPVRMTVPK